MNVPAVSTRSGRRVALLNPSPAQIVIGDIAHGLAHQCRFNGQTNRFYSVAQHSVLVASILPRDLSPNSAIHKADLIVLATERRDLMPMDTADWSCIAGITPLSRRIKPLAPEAAAAQFMDLFFKLSPKSMPAKKPGVLKQWLSHYFPNRLSLS